MSSQACSQCRALNGPEEKFCTNCGASLPPVRNTPTRQAADRLCTRCGELTPAADTFCSRCGASSAMPPQRFTPQIEAPSQRRNGLGWIGAVIGLVCLVLFVGVFLVQAGKAGQENRGQASLRQGSAPELVPDIASPPQATPFTPGVTNNTREMPQQVACPDCNGTGKCRGGVSGVTLTPSREPGRCRSCQGTGHSLQKNALGQYEDCSFCRGTGRCPYCGGSGRCRTCDGHGSVTREVAESIRATDQEIGRGIPVPPITGGSSPGSGTDYMPEDMPKLLGQ